MSSPAGSGVPPGTGVARQGDHGCRALPVHGLDQLVFYLPDAAAQQRIMGRLAAAGVYPVAQIDYWQDNGGVTYRDPDGREVVFASWVYGPPGPEPC